MVDARAELERELADSWAVLAELDADLGDPDPDLLAGTWEYIVWALGELERFEEAIVAADSLLAAAARFGEAIEDRYAAIALRHKRDALVSLGRIADADVVDVESMFRFRDSADPEAREQAAVSLSYHCHLLLGSAERFTEGLILTGDLIGLLEAEPDESVLGLADVAVGHMHILLNAGSEGFLGATVKAIELLWSNTRAVSERAWSSLRSGSPVRLPALSRAGAFTAALTLAMFERTYCRAEVAIGLGQAVVRRLAVLDDDDTAALRARVELSHQLASLMLGRPGAMNGIVEMNSRRDPDVAAAYQRLVDARSPSRSVVQHIGTIATLRLRAEALIGDDPAGARLAFEDSVARAIPGAVSRPVRWLISYFARWP